MPDPQHTEWLQDALPGQADQVEFLDMGEWAATQHASFRPWRSS